MRKSIGERSGLADVDSGDFQILATNNGRDLDISDWYIGAAQTQVAASASGVPSLWNGTDTLVGQGQSSHFVHQFEPTIDFESLSFVYTGGTQGDVIQFGIGNVAVIPEPSSALLGLIGLGFIGRRQRA